MDLDHLDPGADFGKDIREAVGACEVLIAVIGQDWLSVTDAAGHRRLDDTGDFVHLELAAALARDILVIPVLVQDAPMPRFEDLPPDLGKLAQRQAIELSDARWAYDVDRLLQTIEEVLGELGSPASLEPQAGSQPPPGNSLLRNLMGLGFACAPVLLKRLVPFPIADVVPFSIVVVAVGLLAVAVWSEAAVRISPSVAKWWLGIFAISLLMGFVWILKARERFTIPVPVGSIPVDVLVGPSPRLRLPECPCRTGPESTSDKECIRRRFFESTVTMCWGRHTTERLHFEGAYLALTFGWGGLIGLTWLRRSRSSRPLSAGLVVRRGRAAPD